MTYTNIDHITASIPVTTGHYVRLRYHGPTNYKGSRWSATWEGWPSQDGKPVTRWVSYHDVGNLAPQWAASELIRWLNEGLETHEVEVESITCANGMNATDDVLIIQTRAVAPAAQIGG